MDDAASDGKAQAPFDTVWQALPGRTSFETAGVLDTVMQTRESAPIAADDLPEVGHLVEAGAVLGRGGNGEVVSADQLGLNRKIAIKKPLSGEGDTVLAELLLREAHVIGYLEHPNIPPVHFVGRDVDGRLLVALKRIEGETLEGLLGRETGLENLDQNIDILIQVANAVAYAHARGILHLDVKPANVMIGRYGEVYLLDWGLAIAFRDDVPSRLPRPQLHREVCGTPAFVAPETVAGLPATPATDVYQLGGVLHVILTQRSPNAGATVFEAVRSAYQPGPRIFPSEVPKPLVDICEMALRVDPENRYADVIALRDALVAYRRDRRELEALATAQQQVESLLQILSEESDDAATVYQNYGRTRHAIDEASRLLTAKEATQTLLEDVLKSLVRWELARENVGGASLLLSQLPTPNPELAEAIEKQRRRQDHRMAELKSLRHEDDPMIGTPGKIAFLIALGLSVASIEIVPFLLGIEPSPRRMLIAYCIYFVLMLTSSFVLRGHMFKTRVNRGLIHSLWMLSGFGLLLRIGCYDGVIPIHAVGGYDLALVTMVNALAASQFDRRLKYTIVPYGCFTAACFLWPQWAMPFFGLAHFVGLTILTWALAALKSQPISRSRAESEL